MLFPCVQSSVLASYVNSKTLSTDVGIGDSATKETNEGLFKKTSNGRRSLRNVRPSLTRPAWTLRRYAAENINAAALKKFCYDIPDFRESTVWLLKKRYFEKLRKVPHSELFHANMDAHWYSVEKRMRMSRNNMWKHWEKPVYTHQYCSNCCCGKRNCYH